MVNSLKAAGLEVVRNIPRGAGMAIGAAIAGATMAGLGKLLMKGSEAIKTKNEERKVKKAETSTSLGAQQAA